MYFEMKISISKTFSIMIFLLGHSRFSKKNGSRSSNYFTATKTLYQTKCICRFLFRKWSVRLEKMAKTKILAVVRSGLEIADSNSGWSLALNAYYQMLNMWGKNNPEDYFKLLNSFRYVHKIDIYPPSPSPFWQSSWKMYIYVFPKFRFRFFNPCEKCTFLHV